MYESADPGTAKKAEDDLMRVRFTESRIAYIFKNGKLIIPTERESALMLQKRRGRPRKGDPFVKLESLSTVDPEMQIKGPQKNDPRLCPLRECGGESRVLNTKNLVSSGIVQYRICIKCSYRFQTVLIREANAEKLYRSR